MSSVCIIFPHQLFVTNASLKKGNPVYLVEEHLFFRQYKFHKQKIALHRASMKAYETYLTSKKYKVTYINSIQQHADIRKLIQHFAASDITEIEYIDTEDNWLEKRIISTANKYKIQVVKYPSPNFLNTQDELDDFFDKKNRYFQTDFYIWQRKKRNLLLEKDGKPIGGKWTFDNENRLKFPKNETVPAISFPKQNKFQKEAIAYVNKYYSKNYGSIENFQYPVTFTETDNWLENFLSHRLHKFGAYEDAMVMKEGILFHSVLTPMLNIGLLDPRLIIDKAIQKAVEEDIPINSLEGFIRQITGWREFIRIVYLREGTKQRTTNYWKFKRSIPPSFWNATTGILPVDIVIKRILETGYCHHIERLMVLGNFMLLCEFNPDEVYRWFMEMFIDSYDWVMVPNVYGMTQFADGGLMTTKPYISGSNYLMKMGDWSKGEWQNTWDGLFWRFMHVHRSFFESNPRLGMLIRTFDKMPATKKKEHLKNAEMFLNKLDLENEKS